MTTVRSSGRPVVRSSEAARVAAIYDALAAAIEPKSDLAYGSTFELLVAVVLSAQATDASVNLATAKLFPLANTPLALLALGEDGLAPYIRTIGLWRMKARNVIGLCRLLIERHGGEVPAERAALEALPGVGRKTANVVLNIAFGQPTIAVDTHVQRVANRLGFCTTTTPEATEAALLRLTPTQHLMHAHHYLILHGRYTCTARAPRCAGCPVAQWCPSQAAS
jgi:endonuclease-3